MAQSTTSKRGEHAVIAIILYLFVAIFAGALTYMRGFESAGCSGTCDLALMYNASIPFVFISAGLLVLVLLGFVILWSVRKKPPVWLPVTALIVTGVYAIIANILFSIAATTGTS